MYSHNRNYVALGLLLIVQMSHLCDILSPLNISSITKIYEGRPLENVSIAMKDLNDCKVNSSKFKVVNISSWPLNVSDYFETVDDGHLDHLYINACGIPHNCQLQLNTLNDYYFFVATPPKGISPLLKRVLKKSEPQSSLNNRLLSTSTNGGKKHKKNKRKEGLPHLKLSTSQFVHVRINGPFNVKCYISGNRSLFSDLVLHWLHNGKVMKKNTKFTSNGILLRIKRITKRNLGAYSCVALNGSQLHASANMTVEVEKTKRQGHWIPCDQPNYCVHGGKCYFIPKLNRKMCRCRKGFEGTRCAEKVTGHKKLRYKFKRELLLL